MLFDRCTAAEWECVVNKYRQSYVLTNQINSAISLYVKQRLVVEGEDRFGYLLDCAENGDSNSRDAISELFIQNHIVPSDFVYNFEKILNPYSAKGLGDRLYAALLKLPGEIGYSFCLFFEIVKLSPIHNWNPLYTFHSKVKAFTSEPLPYLIQAVTKISTLYNFYEWRV